MHPLRVRLPSLPATLALAALLAAAGCGTGTLTTDGTTPIDYPQGQPLTFKGDPANNAVPGVDVSHYSGPVSQNEMNCLWDSGVRHVIVGTQNPTVSAQQLDMAVRAGMTVDEYVYVYWGTDIASQVQTAKDLAAGRPVGRIWLDLEDDPAGRSQATMEQLIQSGFDACGSTPCGVYTNRNFWKYLIGNPTDFATDKELWYAEYGTGSTLSNWNTEHFGGWTAPTGKQWSQQYVCGYLVDTDTIQVHQTATVPHHGATAPDDGNPPAAPTGLWPTSGLVVNTSDLRLLSDVVPNATSYHFQMERWDGSQFKSYYTWTRSTDDVRITPSYSNTTYRFRVQAENSHGWGTWSDWVVFDFGNSSSHPPTGGGTGSGGTGGGTGSGGTGSGGTGGGTTNVPGTPSGLSPDGGVTITGSSVTLVSSGLAGATNYQFDIEYWTGSQFTSYYTYSANHPSQTFWPSIDTDYRFRVRAGNAQGFGAWSPWATFTFSSGSGTSGGTGSGGTGSGGTGSGGTGGGTTSVPATPTGLSPDGGTTITTASVDLSCASVAGATSYTFDIEYWNGSTFALYYDYTPTSPAQTFWPVYDSDYRFRVRASNAQGDGTWSGWATFTFGTSGSGSTGGGTTGGTGGGTTGGTGGGTTGGTGGTPSVPATPANLSPDGGVTITTASVALACDPVSTATGYTFDIEYWTGSAFASYYTYTPSTPGQTFWPTLDTDYRFRVRASNAQGDGAWSGWATFTFGTGGSTGGSTGGTSSTPAAPTSLAPDGTTVTTPSVTLSSGSVTGATGYELDIEYGGAGAWSAYYTYDTTTPSKTFWPQATGTDYRFRVRAQNANGWGSWSYWATFTYP